MERTPKHMPTSRYFHLVGCITECVLRYGEDNQHVHGGYEEEMAPSLDVNDTDEDESNNSIVHKPFHKPSLENICMDVSESE